MNTTLAEVRALHSDARQRPASPPGPTPLPTGTRLQEFEIASTIGQGGFGIVYLARDLSLQRFVAIKEYMPAHLAGRDGEVGVRPLTEGAADVFELGRRGFINEARMLARFKHPGLLEVLRFWEQNGTAYMAMPYYDGATLTQYLKRHPAVATEAWLKATMRPLIDALGHMHAEDCFHRDVAPDNILILKDGSAVLLDLGAARRVIADDAQALTVMLKPGFAPIEQYADDPRFRQGPWTDIYALAAVLYFGITGRPPPASASRVMRDSVSPLVEHPPPGFGAHFLAAIDLGLSLQPDDRPRSIAQFRALLYADGPANGDPAATIRPRAQARAVAGTGASTASTASATSADRLDDGLDRRPDDVLADDPDDGHVCGTDGGPGGREAAATALRLAGTGRRPVTIATTLAVAAIGLALVFAARGPDADAPAAQAAAPVEGDAPVVAAPAVLSPAAPAVPSPAAPAVPSPAAPAVAQAGPATPKPSAPLPAAAAPASAVHRPPATVGTGTVVLAVKPWAEVRVAGSVRGVTPPLKQLSLPAGRHTIELRNPASPPVRRQVDVAAGRSVVVAHAF